MRQHLADAFDDMNRALNLAVELKQQTFADGIRDELRIMQLIDQTQQDAIAAATKMHELALRR